MSIVPEFEPLDFDEDLHDLFSNEHYMAVKKAIEDAAKGQHPLTTEDLAYAIVAGLYPWGNQDVMILQVIKAMARHSLRPIKVDDLVEGHE